MGLELSPNRQNKRDTEVFNVHLYNRYSWRALFLETGYDVIEIKGIFLKLFSSQQLIYLSEKYDINRIMEDLRRLSEEMQDYAWYLLLAAKLP